MTDTEERDPVRDVTARIIAARKRATLTQKQLSARVRDVLGTFGDSTYRQLEAAPFNDHAEPWKAPLLTQQRVTAIATALDVPLSDLASPEEYAELIDKPARKSRSIPAPVIESNHKPTAVHNPSLVALRIKAFMQMYGYTYRTLSAEMRFRGHPVTETEYRRQLRSPRALTHDVIDGATAVFTAHTRKPFDKQRLLTCEPMGQPCPHCRPYIIEKKGSNSNA